MNKIIFFIALFYTSTVKTQVLKNEFPIAEKKQYWRIQHGDSVLDNYYWMYDYFGKGPDSTKVVNYLAAGTVVWLVLPETREVEVYIPNKPKQTVGIDGVLDGGDVLPGFTLPVKDIFPEDE